ncbi:hypothetical protein MHYP_G00322240 [Metynnis hypsauchen]
MDVLIYSPLIATNGRTPITQRDITMRSDYRTILEGSSRVPMPGQSDLPGAGRPSGAIAELKCLFGDVETQLVPQNGFRTLDCESRKSTISWVDGETMTFSMGFLQPTEKRIQMCGDHRQGGKKSQRAVLGVMQDNRLCLGIASMDHHKLWNMAWLPQEDTSSYSMLGIGIIVEHRHWFHRNC